MAINLLLPHLAQHSPARRTTRAGVQPNTVAPAMVTMVQIQREEQGRCGRWGRSDQTDRKNGSRQLPGCSSKPFSRTSTHQSLPPSPTASHSHRVGGMEEDDEQPDGRCSSWGQNDGDRGPSGPVGPQLVRLSGGLQTAERGILWRGSEEESEGVRGVSRWLRALGYMCGAGRYVGDMPTERVKKVYYLGIAVHATVKCQYGVK